MVLKKYIRPVSATLIFLAMVMLFSCEDITLVLDCSKCNTDEPSDAEIAIKVSSSYNEVLINIYEGNLDDSILYKTITAYGSSASCTLPLNKTFAFSARYFTSYGDIYYVINSITPHVKYVEDQCDEPCYFIYNNTVNLKLKYLR
jgi:hypothetical protein